jgi:hypothetical protein
MKRKYKKSPVCSECDNTNEDGMFIAPGNGQFICYDCLQEWASSNWTHVDPEFEED